MQLHHSIHYNIINEQNLPFELQIFINQDLKKIISFSDLQNNNLLDFDYNYKQKNNCLEFVFKGQEQQQKLLKINSIKIHNTNINVLSGLYETESNEWWQSLNQDQLSQARKRVLSHGGNFGWFGKISYYYEIQSKQLNANDQTSIASLFRSNIRV